jgi:hypothetical protein
MLGYRRHIALVALPAVLIVFAGCGAPDATPAESSAQAAPKPGGVPASQETTEALGVTEWQGQSSDGAVEVHGYDADGAVRAAVRFSTRKDAQGNSILSISSKPPGTEPATATVRPLSEDQIAVLENTFVGRTDAQQTLEHATADLRQYLVQAQASGLSTTSLRPTNWLTDGVADLVCGKLPSWVPSWANRMSGCVGQQLAYAAMPATAGMCVAGGAETVGMACAPFVVNIGGAGAMGVRCIDGLTNGGVCPKK